MRPCAGWKMIPLFGPSLFRGVFYLVSSPAPTAPLPSSLPPSLSPLLQLLSRALRFYLAWKPQPSDFMDASRKRKAPRSDTEDTHTPSNSTVSVCADQEGMEQAATAYL